MTDTPSSLPRTLWIGLLLVLVLLCLAYALSLMELNRFHRRTAPPVLGAIAGFTLTNQDGQVVTLADLSNHVWVADIVFTRCGGPCPVMSESMQSLQGALPPASRAKLVTLTTDPEFDTAPVLKKYAERFGADSNRWMFLTGPKVEVARLAANSLKLSAVPVKPEEQKDPADLFIHTTMFVIVDKQARLRAVFETQGEGVNWTNVQPRIVALVSELEHEP
ncbi:MAG TPA: SCO family protein [Candidatus Acidoferrum sp.]|nr:SCO family protein [Candidatus Acidoferrum sp.]